ncbi:MAG: methyltransferase [Zetaproteobacteria bacterium CG12_big_fil_rev_8_21_14_0_65_55_1124]|nr:MAG: hypothetical protein AUJ58_08960 [Zetaproteobacteria bacterium CG1_02_55_237]PIS20540.1 MAG: methyltransferase [Zetaproteobacteria bacterium CG08_land_8_20_14_0_20_55_17]PIW43819.1 MAG: methyltransferase [Zetaproteobacteria bacterium CG12_big_fil_rev_8_21_14_0_65_55_1124]PIY53355.1 MAG: methyltransferase [Zetaproteobacteria bacterium CG_4_10_14_0_8_um_filter_55_43]PIZ40166.1 MAG: methyltransferase [Zetaproteobacteria bacterium CG_4_10_14_0_2_um_filter_55_20]PJB82170.1 MAG: methyltransf
MAWNQFYESERVVLERIAPASCSRVLDVGCGCGGLGLALKERFSVSDYTGIEINQKAVATARKMNPHARFLEGDFLAMKDEFLIGGAFDLVFSLSCIDWNISFDAMLQKAWSMVKPGGSFIASFRLTCEAGVDDINRSYQYINYDGKMEGELASYVVVNASKILSKFFSLDADKITGYGYNGTPGKTAVTPYGELCFAVFAIRKKMDGDFMEVDLRLPNEILRSVVCATKEH